MALVQKAIREIKLRDRSGKEARLSIEKNTSPLFLLSKFMGMESEFLRDRPKMVQIFGKRKEMPSLPLFPGLQSEFSRPIVCRFFCLNQKSGLLPPFMRGGGERRKRSLEKLSKK